MEILHPRCAGLDVHKDSVVACARIVTANGIEQHVETFGTTTSTLLALSDWLTEYGVTHVAMEATGVYWRPVWHVLEGDFDLVLANAMHIKNVPGRKTDVTTKARRGPRKAIVAVAASILTAVYYMLARGSDYHDLGPAHFDRTDRQKVARRLVRKLSDLGFRVDLQDAA